MGIPVSLIVLRLHNLHLKGARWLPYITVTTRAFIYGKGP